MMRLETFPITVHSFEGDCLDNVGDLVPITYIPCWVLSPPWRRCFPRCFSWCYAFDDYCKTIGTKDAL